MSRERYDALHLRLGFPKVPNRIVRPILHYLVVFIASDGSYRMWNSACEMLSQCVPSTCKLVIPGLNTEITSVRLEAIDQSRISQWVCFMFAKRESSVITHNAWWVMRIAVLFISFHPRYKKEYYPSRLFILCNGFRVSAVWTLLKWPYKLLWMYTQQ